MVALGWNCDFGRARELAHQLIGFAERCQARYYLRHVYSLLHLANSMQGNREAAQQSLERAQAVVDALATPEPLAFLRYCQAFAAYLAGDAETMAAHIVQAIDLLRSDGNEALVWYLGIEALAHLGRGRHAEARAVRAELETLADATPTGAFPSATVFSHLTVFALAAGEHDCLPDLYPQLLPFRGQYHDALIDRLLGTIEVVRGEWDQASDSLDAAEAIARREQLSWELAHTLASRASLELARGGTGSAMRARAFLAEARELFKMYGNKAQERGIHERLRDLPRQPGERSPALLPAGLSRRESDVLRLLARGKSNQEIAEELALSGKTVANHVTMIFNKIGVANRAAAAAFAVKQGLA